MEQQLAGLQAPSGTDAVHEMLRATLIESVALWAMVKPLPHLTYQF
jgi:hypothetical protein